jgi:rhodanese-related sulfurtransferase
MKALVVDTFIELMNDDTIILDTRDIKEFIQGFIPGSIYIGSDKRSVQLLGRLLLADIPVLLVGAQGKENITELEKMGIRKVLGYLDGGYNSWIKSGEPTDMIINVEADELLMDIPFDKNLVLIDVRQPSEFGEGHLKDAINIPLSEMSDPGIMANIEDHHNLYLYCDEDYRSIAAASLLKRQGIHNLRNVSGGWNEIQKLGKVNIVKEKSMLN